MDEHRQRTVATGQRKPGRSSDFATSTRTTRIEVSTSVKQPARQGMEGLCPVHAEETSEESSSSQQEIQDSNVTELSISDERVTQIETILDLWSGSLKTNVLTELRKWKLHFIEHHRLEMSQEREKHAAHVRQLTNRLENLKELLQTYEMSIGRKDEVIASLTHAIEKQKDRIELMKRFTKWRLQHFMGKQESRHEVYTDLLANRLYEIGLLKKAWGVWRSASHRKWKEALERAYQSNAESERVELSNDYEAKIQELNAALDEARNKLLEMQNKRQDYEDAMKKAFMRGVCALNLEAMTIFQGKEIKLDHAFDLSDKKAEPDAGATAAKLPPSQFDRHLLPPPSSSPPPPPPPAPPPTACPTSVPAEDLFSSHRSHAVTSQTRLDSAGAGAGTATVSNLPLTRIVTSAQQKAGRTITARITGRSDFGPKNRYGNNLAVFGVSPPMNSIVVEKHHPVTQQTISQATAAKYPRTLHHFPSTTSTRPSGHSGKTPPQPHSIIQSIKVVD
ncbi:centrosomal protein POC5 isoform X2 [Heteronotia binoei]|nr:centrosomal protein POC5 isoform X2 [Heteronotia binoei]